MLHPNASVEKNSKANIPDAQTATFDFGDLNVIWQHRTYGHPEDPKYPWGATFYGLISWIDSD